MAKQLQEYREDLESMLSVEDISGFFTEDIKDEYINYGGRAVYNFQTWAWLKHAMKTETDILLDGAGEWYPQPNEFKSGSIYRITLKDADGTEREHDIVDLNSYEDYQLVGSTERVATLMGDKYFVNPIPTVSGLEIGVYGQLKWVTLANDTDRAICPDAFDESIVKLAFAKALKKERRFSEANSEIDDVLNLNNGILARLYQQDMKKSPKGYIGQQKSTRW